MFIHLNICKMKTTQALSHRHVWFDRPGSPHSPPSSSHPSAVHDESNIYPCQWPGHWWRCFTGDQDGSRWDPNGIQMPEMMLSMFSGGMWCFAPTDWDTMIQEPLETWCFPQVGIRSGGTMLRPPGLVIHRDWCEVDFLPVICPRTSNYFLVKYLLLVSWDYEIPNIWKNKKCSKPPTSIAF